MDKPDWYTRQHWDGRVELIKNNIDIGIPPVNDEVAAIFWADERIRQLEAVLRECDEYLAPNPLNNIGCNSILHRKMKEALQQENKDA